MPFRACLSNWHITKRQLAAGGDTVFSWLCSTTGHLRCKEPLDKIYGVLGMALPEDRAAIIPDYKKSMEEVLTEVVLRSRNVEGFMFRESTFSLLSLLNE